ncbi:MAG: hypothetical protein ACI9BD_001440 [Candidatus Marinamargulisbacteria bacterium]|jgi:hypothetical protein
MEERKNLSTISSMQSFNRGVKKGTYSRGLSSACLRKVVALNSRSQPVSRSFFSDPRIRCASIRLILDEVISRTDFGKTGRSFGKSVYIHLDNLVNYHQHGNIGALKSMLSIAFRMRHSLERNTDISKSERNTLNFILGEIMGLRSLRVSCDGLY